MFFLLQGLASMTLETPALSGQEMAALLWRSKLNEIKRIGQGAKVGMDLAFPEIGRMLFSPHLSNLGPPPCPHAWCFSIVALLPLSEGS